MLRPSKEMFKEGGMGTLSKMISREGGRGDKEMGRN
jgi:hypothetical protein